MNEHMAHRELDEILDTFDGELDDEERTMIQSAFGDGTFFGDRFRIERLIARISTLSQLRSSSRESWLEPARSMFGIITNS